MYRVANETGRLVEIAIWSPVSIDETTQWQRDHDAVIASVAGPYVCFVDLRGARVFPPEVVNAYVAVMRDEQRLERTATLLPGSPTVAMQIGRMIREAGHPQRRGFQDRDALYDWLAKVLDDNERSRLERLLDAPIHR